MDLGYYGPPLGFPNHIKFHFQIMQIENFQKFIGDQCLWEIDEGICISIVLANHGVCQPLDYVLLLVVSLKIQRCTKRKKSFEDVSSEDHGSAMLDLLCV